MGELPSNFAPQEEKSADRREDLPAEGGAIYITDPNFFPTMIGSRRQIILLTSINEEAGIGISHLLRGDEARRHQLGRLEAKISSSQSEESAKVRRWKKEKQLLREAINREAGGLPSQEV